MSDHDEHATMLEDCEKRESKLTAWEHDFIMSIRDQLDAGRKLSEKQATTLDTIWERVT